MIKGKSATERFNDNQLIDYYFPDDCANFKK